MQNIILASSSIYRRELLSRLQISFTTFSPDINETRLIDESITDHVLRLSAEKAQAAGKTYPHAVCIGSDEVAALGHQILGKPGTHSAAITQLQQMSGQKVHFYTGICVYAPFLHHLKTTLVMTAVVFRTLSLSMIENYLHKEKPYFSAGSFKSETLGSALIERFEGDDPTAMIGLPLITLCDMLKEVGINVI